jgi:hypothetical protein
LPQWAFLFLFFEKEEARKSKHYVAIFLFRFAKKRCLAGFRTETGYIPDGS